MFVPRRARARPLVHRNSLLRAYLLQRVDARRALNSARLSAPLLCKKKRICLMHIFRARVYFNARSLNVDCAHNCVSTCFAFAATPCNLGIHTPLNARPLPALTSLFDRERARRALDTTRACSTCCVTTRVHATRFFALQPLLIQCVQIATPTRYSCAHVTVIFNARINRVPIQHLN